LCCLAFAISATTAWIPWQERQTKVSDSCWKAIEGCSNKTLTTGRCKSTYGGFVLDWLRNDVDVNCKAGPADYIPDVTDFYDPNQDGLFCGSEWTERRLSYVGFTRETLDGTWAILNQGRDCLAISDLGGFPEQDLKTSFSSQGVGRLVTFCNQGNNLATNRECMGLPFICRDKRPDLESCKNLPVNKDTRSLWQRVNLNAVNCDPNNDGIVTIEEQWAYIRDEIDTNRDGCASRDEWVRRWTDYYGFSADYGRAFYDTLNDGDNCMNRDDVVRVFSGQDQPRDFIPGNFVGLVVQMCEANPALYSSNPECAQVADTCNEFLSDLDACKVYSSCGVKNYQTCVRLLPLGGDCRGDLDRDEIHLESHRVQNQLRPGTECKDYQESCRKFTQNKEAFMELFKIDLEALESEDNSAENSEGSQSADSDNSESDSTEEY